MSILDLSKLYQVDDDGLLFISPVIKEWSILEAHGIDTVIDLDERERGAANGINFNPVTQEALNAGLRRASLLWRDRPQWARVQANGMASDVSWSASARRYASLYAELLARKD